MSRTRWPSKLDQPTSDPLKLLKRDIDSILKWVPSVAEIVVYQRLLQNMQ